MAAVSAVVAAAVAALNAPMRTSRNDADRANDRHVDAAAVVAVATAAVLCRRQRVALDNCADVAASPIAMAMETAAD